MQFEWDLKEEAVNDALRSPIEVAQRSVGPTKRSSRRQHSAAAELCVRCDLSLPVLGALLLKGDHFE